MSNLKLARYHLSLCLSTLIGPSLQLNLPFMVTNHFIVFTFWVSLQAGEAGELLEEEEGEEGWDEFSTSHKSCSIFCHWQLERVDRRLSQCWRRDRTWLYKKPDENWLTLTDERCQLLWVPTFVITDFALLYTNTHQKTTHFLHVYSESKAVMSKQE